MCKDCFEEEINSFADKSEWEKFDLELSKKLAAGKLIQTKFKRDGRRDKDDGIYNYKCITCGQKWKLRDALYDLNEASFKKRWF